MEREAKAKMHLSCRKKIALIALILVILASLEVYAHTYVQIRSLPVVTMDEAMHSLPFENNTGTYVFSSTGCQWLIVWKVDEAFASMNFGYISIFKVEQNRSLFTLNTDMVVARLDPTSNHTGWFEAALDEVLYENNRTDARIRYYFGEIDTYQIDFGLVVQVYEETLLARALEASVDEKTRVQVMQNCGYNCAKKNHKMIERAVERRKKYATTDDFLAAEQQHPMKGTKLAREGSILHQFYTPQEFTRPMRCYCGLFSGLPTEETVSLTYCNCSKGFAEKYWEAILGKPVRVDLLQSAISGAKECKFAIHL